MCAEYAFDESLLVYTAFLWGSWLLNESLGSKGIADGGRTLRCESDEIAGSCSCLSGTC